MSKVPERYAATSEQWADAIRQEERERIISILLKVEESCDCGHCRRADHYMDNILYLINRTDEIAQ
jgi:hypothetical protein